MKMNKLTVAILISMMFGILTGQGYRMFAADQAADFANNITILTDIFLRLIKMIIAPLVFTTLVVGIAKMGDTRTVGRIGAKTLGWFMLASLMSLSLGLVMVTLMQPGVGLSLSLPNDTASSGIAAGAITLKDFVTHAIPKSVVEAMATNEILQIVVFSLFFGLAAAALGDLAKPVVVLMASAAEIMLKVTGYVMNFAPFAVFGAIAAMVAKEGLGILVTYGSFMAQFLYRAGLPLAAADRHGQRLPAWSRHQAAGDDPRTHPARLLDRQLRSGLSEDPGSSGEVRL